MAMITEGTERLYELGGATFGADAAESVARGPDFIAAVQGIDAIVSRINAAFSVPNTDYELTIAASAVPLALDNLAKAIRRAGMRALVPDPH
jgi:alcohol dehydrogenase class IV